MNMKCPKCKKPTRVIDTRLHYDDKVIRKRECVECKYRFITIEKFLTEVNNGKQMG